MTRTLIFFVMLILIACTKEGSLLPKGPETISALEELLRQDKFHFDMNVFYPGAPDEATRRRAESYINIALSALISKTESGVTEEEFWATLQEAAEGLSKMDSAELDRGLTYMEQIMDIYSIESSGGRLNTWRYGFDPG